MRPHCLFLRHRQALVRIVAVSPVIVAGKGLPGALIGGVVLVSVRIDRRTVVLFERRAQLPCHGIVSAGDVTIGLPFFAVKSLTPGSVPSHLRRDSLQPLFKRLLKWWRDTNDRRVNDDCLLLG